MAKMKLNPQLGVYPVQDLAIGEYVRKIKICKVCNGDGCTEAGQCVRCNTLGYEGSNKVYKVGVYDRSEHRWPLNDCDDISRCVYVKRNTKLLAGFTY